MKRRNLEMWKKIATKSVVAVTSVALLTACGAGEDNADGGSAVDSSGDSDKGVTDKVADAFDSTPEASEDQLLLTNEVQGTTFEKTSDTSFDEVVDQFDDENMRVEPAECSNIDKEREQFKQLTSASGEFKDENVVISIALTKDKDVHKSFVDDIERCPEMTVTVHNDDLLKDAMPSDEEMQNLSPEMQDMFDGLEMDSTMKLHRQDWEPELSSKPQDLKTTETTVNSSVAGVESNSVSYDIIGVVNGVVVMVSAAPVADMPDVDPNAPAEAITMEDASPEAKEAAKKRAAEVFDAQAKKIEDAD
ncbi:MAG: hypothetical protein Q4E11_04380 [Corynebacterium sp.]|uniref:hypothetical protein n=1 Tax=Corynebacterium sp. TaxID=1720 RepID=UPI0026DB94BF|nr:hypothetical protein [Corynebacterium sp.]MDO5029804.1 hypothetical protein [Corynebacterium sp.]